MVVIHPDSRLVGGQIVALDSTREYRHQAGQPGSVAKLEDVIKALLAAATQGMKPDRAWVSPTNRQMLMVEANSHRPITGARQGWRQHAGSDSWECSRCGQAATTEWLEATEFNVGSRERHVCQKPTDMAAWARPASDEELAAREAAWKRTYAERVEQGPGISAMRPDNSLYMLDEDLLCEDA